MMEITCPDCSGRGHNFGFIERVDRTQSGAGQIPCRTCNSTGALSPERADSVALCGQLRDKRHSLDLTISRAASLLGISRPGLSALESGRGAREAVEAALAHLETLPPFDAVAKAAQQERIQNVTDCLERGVSPCCKTPLDLSRVIQNGRYKGHGPKICRTCRRVVSRQ